MAGKVLTHQKPNAAAWAVFSRFDKFNIYLRIKNVIKNFIKIANYYYQLKKV